MPRAAVAAAAVHPSPAADAEPIANLSPGDSFAVLEFAGGWAWGFVQETHLVGYVPAVALGEAAQR